MKGLKAAANSCQRTRTRQWSVELDSFDLYFVIAQTLLRTKLGIDYDESESLWQQCWQEIKNQSSYTVRVNGRMTIRKQKVLSKSTRRRINEIAKFS